MPMPYEAMPRSTSSRKSWATTAVPAARPRRFEGRGTAPTGVAGVRGSVAEGLVVLDEAGDVLELPLRDGQRAETPGRASRRVRRMSALLLQA